MRYLILVLVASFSTLLAEAQTISGRVLDENGKGLAHATVFVRRATDSLVVKYAISGDEGTFRLTIKQSDTLRLQASFAGYRKKDTLLFAQGDMVINLRLSRSEESLQAVSVTTTKPLFDVQPDKLVFNVSQSIASAGGSAFELLQKSPGVLVDPYDAVSMNGKTGVRIYLDGRPSPLSLQEITALLRTLPATDVDAIEIITNPSSRYEAAGNAGIINIRLKKNKTLGTNASLNAGWGIGTFPKYNAGISLNHRRKKLNLFGGHSYNRSQNESSLNLLRFQNDSLYDQRSRTLAQNAAHNGKVGADWFVNPQQTLGILVNINSSRTSSASTSTTPIAAQVTKQVGQTLDAFSSSLRNRLNVTTNLNYRFGDTAGRTLSVDADYSYFNLDGRAASLNRFLTPGNGIRETGFSSRTPVHIQFNALQASWEQRLAKGKFSAGFRTTYAKTSNQFSFFNDVDRQLFDAGRSNDFAYTERIGAVYAQYNRSLKKWSYQLGLRLEQTRSLGELTSQNPTRDQTVKRSYLNAFPSAGLSYQLGMHQLGVSLSRRLDRPSYQDLNPFENRLDELTYQKGNPFLKPQYTSTIELRHTYESRFTTTLSYAEVQDFFASITDTIEGRRNFIMQRNIASQRIYSLSSNLPFNLTGWWSGFASLGVNHNRYRADFGQGKEVHINNTVASIYQQHSFRLNRKITAEVSAFYLSPYVWAGNYECRSIWNIDVGMQWKLLGDRGNVKLSVTDLFQRLPWAGTSRLGNFFIVASGAWESRQLRLNFTYRLGRSEIKAARQRTTGVDDLNKRVQ